MAWPKDHPHPLSTTREFINVIIEMRFRHIMCREESSLVCPYVMHYKYWFFSELENCIYILFAVLWHTKNKLLIKLLVLTNFCCFVLGKKRT